MKSIIRPKRPHGPGWVQLSKPDPQITLGFAGERWYYPEHRIGVISAVEVVTETDGSDRRPEYHISMSLDQRRRCDRNTARFVVKAFGMTDALEDNHVPGGFVRNYWLPVGEKRIGYKCPCTDHEPAMVEDKGDFVWRGITK